MTTPAQWNVYHSMLTGHQMFCRADADKTPLGHVAGFPFGRCIYRINVKPKVRVTIKCGCGHEHDSFSAWQKCPGALVPCAVKPEWIIGLG
jgi:hypothetical protein